MTQSWLHTVPRPLAFVLSGGAALGAIQVGMLKALHRLGIEPDLVLGTSVGALNGATIAAKGMADGISALEALWLDMQRSDVFPGGPLAQARHFLTYRHSIFPNNKLAELGCRMLDIQRFAEMKIPFGALATELLTHHGVLFTTGEVVPAILASAAIPGIYPPVEIGTKSYVDGALTAQVPMDAALQMGAKSIVVLDAGELCHRQAAPNHIAEMIASTVQAALRQRIRIEAPMVAEKVPLIYLPTPCPVKLSGGIFDFSESADLIDRAQQMTKIFLASAEPARAGAMCGAPHFHDNEPAYKLTHVA